MTKWMLSLVQVWFQDKSMVQWRKVLGRAAAVDAMQNIMD